MNGQILLFPIKLCGCGCDEEQRQMIMYQNNCVDLVTQEERKRVYFQLIYNSVELKENLL